MRIGIACAVITAVLLAAGPSFAQPAFNSIGKGGGGGATAAKPKEVPPPALPGAAANASRVTPSDRPATDLEPNDALFDAINRGDIAAARDAISRGAELNTRNVLGMTPMELSIDLGRNDISFMLLSMRGGDNGGNRPPPVNTAAKSPAAKPVKQTAVRPPPVPSTRAAASAQQPVPSQTARLFSGDGGTPVPSAGFLGFDSGRR